MSRNDKQKKTAKEPVVQASRMPYVRFTAEPQPDRYAAPEQPLYGFKAEALAELCGVSVATARRWKAGTSQMPALTAAALAAGLVYFLRDWPGWKFEGQEIISPDGLRINRNDALSVPYMHGQIAALRQRIKELEALTDEQPYPGAYPDTIKA